MWRCFTFSHIRSHLRWSGVLNLFQFRATPECLHPLCLIGEGWLRPLGSKTQAGFDLLPKLSFTLPRTTHEIVTFSNFLTFFIKKDFLAQPELLVWSQTLGSAKHRQKWTQHLQASEFPWLKEMLFTDGRSGRSFVPWAKNTQCFPWLCLTQNSTKRIQNWS